MKKLIWLSPVAALLAACNDGNDLPALVIDSHRVQDAQVHMDVYAQSDGDETELSVYLHRHRNDGLIQFLELSEGDALAAQSEAWTASFESQKLPADHDPSLVYYSDTSTTPVSGDSIQVQLTRNSSVLLEAQATILAATDFSVSSSTTPVTMQSTLSTQWTAVDGVDYHLHYHFSCDTADGDTNFGVRYPNYQDGEIESPFELDLAQFEPPSSEVSNCKILVELYGTADQSAVQNADPDVLQVKASRRQEVELDLEI